jgi:hypothetical protein
LVDSEFVLSQLVKRANLSALKSVYDMSLELGDRTTQGMFYERLIHHWFQSSVPESTVPEDGYQYLGITAVVWSTGTGDEGLTELDSQGKYWIPSIPNFANIDAAVVRDGTLHAFQYTVRDKHDFTEETFTSFVQKVVQNVAGVAQNVKVHFISPTAPLSWNGRNDNSNTFDIVIPPQDRQTRSSLLQDSIFTVSFHFHQLKLDVKDVDAACRVCFKNCFQN